MTKRPSERRAEPLFPLVGLRPPEAGDQPPAPVVPGPVTRGWRRLRRAWRPWWTVVAVALVIAVAVATPLPQQVVSSSHPVDAATLVTVEVTDPAAEEGGHTGTYLVPATQPATIATAALALVLPQRHLTELLPPRMQEYDAIDTALLSGIGVAPYLGGAEQFGLRATFPQGQPDPLALGLLLEVHDQASSLDLAAGRTIVVVASVLPDGTAVCTPGAQDTVNAASDIDVVVAGPDCAAELEVGDAQLLEVPSFADAIVGLSQ